MKTDLRKFITFFTENACPRLSVSEQNQLLRIARANNMLSALACQQAECDYGSFPDFWRHLQSAKIYAERQHRQIAKECDTLVTILADVNVEPIFLKGAAYVLASDDNASGRLMSDIDILVPFEHLDAVEQCLRAQGWFSKKITDYDSRYYRDWAHELPPFVHKSSGTVLDVHHNILPPVTGKALQNKTLFEQVEVVQGQFPVLTPEFRLLHCVVHLLYNEDFEHGFRDIFDVYLLKAQLKHRGQYQQAKALMQSLGFEKELALVNAVTGYLFKDTPENASSDLSFTGRTLVKHIHAVAMEPNEANLSFNRQQLSKNIMYIRGHIKKMPLKILIPHFFAKSYQGILKAIYGKYHFEH